jgi:lipopolysaccharide transport system permease protein
MKMKAGKVKVGKIKAWTVKTGKVKGAKKSMPWKNDDKGRNEERSEERNKKMQNERNKKEHNKERAERDNHEGRAFNFQQRAFLIKELAVNEFRLRYKNAWLGYFWSIITPLLMLATLYVVFSNIVNLSLPHYQLFLLIGIIMWNFMSEATTQSMYSIVNKKPMINRAQFHREDIVIASCITSSATFLINIAIFFAIGIASNLAFRPENLFFIITLAEIFMITLGASFILAALYPRFKDTAHTWNILLLIGFWITPIIYKESQVAEQYRKFYMLNPIARLINEARDILIYDYVPSFKQMLITFALCAAIFAIGLWYFRKRAPYFAEEV